VLLTDGIATKHTSLELVQSLIDNSECMTEYPDPDNPEGGETIKVSKNEMCGIDLADFLVENDHVEKEPGTKNTVTLHTIGFQLGKAWRTIYADASNDKRIYKIDGKYYYDEAGEEPVPDGTKRKKYGYEENVKGTATNERAVKYLKRLASESTSGNRNFYPADTAEELVKAFEEITAQAMTTSTSFAAPGVSVNLENNLIHNNDVYYALFTPSKNQLWDGNVKKFRFEGDILVGQDRVAAIADGSFSSNVRSFWTSTETEENGEVTKGGAGEQLESSTRNIYTYLDEASPGANHKINLTEYKIEVSSDSPDFNETLGKKLFGDDTFAEEQRDNLIRWIIGENVNPIEEGESSSESNADRWMFGDPLHSTPKAIAYSIAETRVFVGTNDGLLRMIDDTDGKEVWAFLPQELLSIQNSLMENQSGVGRIYGLDSTPVFWRNDRDKQINSQDGDFIRLYIGMRRGGRNIYALDITGEDKPGVPPKLMWVIKGGEGSYAKLGQTWSSPKLMLVNPKYCGTKVCVALLFAGGYDPSQDESLNSSIVNMGNAIYMVSASTGKRLWWASNDKEADLELKKMVYPIPSDLAYLDSTGDGYTDRIYVGDIGGQVWRIDLEPENEKGAALANFSKIKSSARVDKRSFFYPPEMLEVKGVDIITIVSGRRPNPLAGGNREHDQFFAFIDNGWELDDNGNMSLKTPTLEQKNMVPVDIYADSEDTNVNLLDLKDDEDKGGWSLNLKEESGEWVGEKGLAPPVISDKKVFFTTYIPPAKQMDACFFDEGKSRIYRLDLLSGNPLNKEEPFVEAGPGIVTEPLVMNMVEKDEEGHTKKGGTKVYNPKGTLLDESPPPIQRTFWMQNSASDSGFNCALPIPPVPPVP
jgi:type IV pilus assembly protein PilY1